MPSVQYVRVYAIRLFRRNYITRPSLYLIFLDRIGREFVRITIIIIITVDRRQRWPPFYRWSNIVLCILLLRYVDAANLILLYIIIYNEYFNRVDWAAVQLLLSTPLQLPIRNTVSSDVLSTIHRPWTCYRAVTYSGNFKTYTIPVISLHMYHSRITGNR